MSLEQQTAAFFNPEKTTKSPTSCYNLPKRPKRTEEGTRCATWSLNSKTVRRDNKALNRFFQLKQTSPKLWNFLDQALELNFNLVHVPGIEIRAADYLSHSRTALADNVHLKLTNPMTLHGFEKTWLPKRLNKMRMKKTSASTR